MGSALDQTIALEERTQNLRSHIQQAILENHRVPALTESQKQHIQDVMINESFGNAAWETALELGGGTVGMLAGGFSGIAAGVGVAHIAAGLGLISISVIMPPAAVLAGSLIGSFIVGTAAARAGATAGRRIDKSKASRVEIMLSKMLDTTDERDKVLSQMAKQVDGSKKNNRLIGQLDQLTRDQIMFAKEAEDAVKKAISDGLLTREDNRAIAPMLRAAKQGKFTMIDNV